MVRDSAYNAFKDDPVWRSELVRLLWKKRGEWPPRLTYIPGQVIEYRKAGKHACGVLLRSGARGLRILGVDGKEFYLPREHLVDVSRQLLDLRLSRHDLVLVLRDLDRHREEVKARIDLRELWQVVALEGGEYTLDELAGLCLTEPMDPDEKAAFARALDEGFFFDRKGQKFVAKSPAIVKRHLREAKALAETETEKRKAAAWLRRTLDGEYALAPEWASQAIALLEEVVVWGAEAPHFREAQQLMRLAGIHSTAAAFQALVKLGYFEEDENLLLRRYQIPITFSPEAEQEADKAYWPREALHRPRYRCRHAYAISEGTECHEHAFSLKPSLFGFKVGIHIVTPASLIAVGGRIEEEAAERAASIHLPDRTIPMLPAGLWKGKAALLAGTKRPALTIEIRFNRRKEVTGYRLKLSRVQITRSLTFEEVDRRIENDKYLRSLYEVAIRLRESRRQAGAVIIPAPEVKVTVRDKKVNLMLRDFNSPSQTIVRELTVAANALVGEFCVSNRLPAICCVQDAPAENLLTENLYDPVLCYHQRNLMAKAHLQVTSGRQSGLGLDAYVPITQPFGRYTDLLMHRQIDTYLATGSSAYSEGELREAILCSAYSVSVASEIEAASQRYWILKYLEGKRGKSIAAVVLDRRRAGYIIELSDCLLRAFCPASLRTGLAPGDRITVRIVGVSAREDFIRVLPEP